MLLAAPLSAQTTQPASAPNTGEIDDYLAQQVEKLKLPSLSVGIVRGDTLVYTKSIGLADRATGRAATPDTLYRIGSVTKVFTATLLAALRDAGVVQLDDPVAQFLPPEVTLPTDPRGAPKVTLRHLATHTSGLPRQPVNLKRSGKDAYGGFTAEALHEGLSRTRLRTPIGAEVRYSNLGFGLLGHALARAAGKPYETLVKERICLPLGMADTTIVLTPEQQARFAVGYEEKDTTKPAVEWNLGVLSPAGALASTVTDLARFLSLQLHAAEANVTPIAGGTLLELQTPQRLIGGWDRGISLGWHINNTRKSGAVVWHNGEVAGHHSYIAFSPGRKVGVIVLTNCARSIDSIGVWLMDRAITQFAAPPTATQPADAEVQRVANALCDAIAAEPPNALASLFSDEFLGQVPIDRIQKLLAGLFEQFGRCEGVEVRASKDAERWTLVFKFAGGETSRAELGLDDQNPARIEYLLFPPF